MNIRKSTLLSVNLAALIFLGVLLLSTNLVIINSFEQIEKSDISKDMQRLSYNLNSALDQLEKNTTDWAVWDDTWNFVQDSNAQYIESNFTSNTYTNYGLSLVVIYNLNQEIVYSQTYDQENDVLEEPDPELVSFIKNKLSMYLKHSDNDNSKGYILSPLGSLAFVAVPIVKSDASGPHAGHMLMAKRISPQTISSLSGFTGQTISAIELPTLSNPDLQTRNHIALVRAEKPIIINGKQSISMFSILKDTNSKDLFLIELKSPLRLTSIARNMRNVMVLIFIGLTISQSLLLSYFLARKLIRPLLSLQRQVQKITRNPEDTEMVKLGGSDELFLLSQDINKMLQALHKTQEDLLSAKDAAEESNRLKTAFLATMNHELRTPLNHIVGYGQLITMSGDPKEVNSYAQQILASSNTLLQLIQDIFDLALAEQSSLKANLQPVKTMDQFFENKAHLEEILEASGKSEYINLLFSPDRSAWNKSVRIDSVKVNQVLSNLFRNAVKFTPSGTIEFGFDLIESSTIRYWVKDSGIGINPDKQEIIFDFFRQADESNTRLYGGVGIGLAFSKKVCEILGGKLYLESQEGLGSTFFLELNCEICEIDTGIRHISTSNTDFPDFGVYKVLICDNEMIAKSIVLKLLKKTTAQTTEAKTVQDVMRILETTPDYNLVIVGTESKKEIDHVILDKLKSDYPHIAIMAIQSLSTELVSEAHDDNHFDSIINQPIDRETLYKEINRLLSRGETEESQTQINP